MSSVLYDAPGPKAKRRQLIYTTIGTLAIAAFLGVLIWTLAKPRIDFQGTEKPGMFDPSRWDVMADPTVWESIGRGVWATLSAAAVASVLAIIFGIMMSLLASSESKWIRYPTTALLEFFRGMPVLLMMLFLLLLVFQGAPFWAVVTALTVYNGTLIGEILRAGLRSLPRGQREAGLTIGLSGARTRFLIEFPQAFKQMTPIIVAQLVVLLKDTSLGYVISYPELLRNNMSYLASYYGNNYMFTFFFVTLAIYLVINLLVSWFAKYLSRRMTAQQKPRHGGPGGHGSTGEPPGVEPVPPTTSMIAAHTGK